MNLKDPRAYAVRVGDHSMSPGIKKGWMILVSPEAKISDNDYVVVLLKSGEVLLREWCMQDKSVGILQAMHTDFKPS